MPARDASEKYPRLAMDSSGKKEEEEEEEERRWQEAEERKG